LLKGVSIPSMVSRSKYKSLSCLVVPMTGNPTRQRRRLKSRLRPHQTTKKPHLHLPVSLSALTSCSQQMITKLVRVAQAAAVMSDQVVRMVVSVKAARTVRRMLTV
jgi:hypothetical protein